MAKKKSQPTKIKGAVYKKVKLSSLLKNPVNSRIHDENDLPTLMASLSEWGQCDALVVQKSTGLVIGGNGRLEAMHRLGWTEVDIAEVDLDDKASHALGITLNRTAEMSSWNAENVEKALAEIDLDSPELKEMFDDLAKQLELGQQAAGTADAEPQIDRAAELQKKWQTKTGDLWLIGEHRLLCGDNAADGNLNKLFAGKQSTLLFTDPPYGVGVGAKNRLLNSVQPSGRCLTDIEDDELSPTDLKATLLKSFQAVYSFLADDCSVFVCSPQGGGLSMMMMMMQEACLATRHIMIWKKNAPTFSMGRLDYDYQHEPILFTWKKTHKRNKAGDYQTSLWEVDKPRASADHPTMKPVELPTNAILNHTDAGDIVSDIFLGSGTTMIAAQNLGRICYGIEISPAYCAVILERMTTAFPDIEVKRGK